MVDVKEKLKVCWLSAGVSSFVAGYLAKNVDEYIYIDIENQHPDSMRFIKDCERHLGNEVKILISLSYKGDVHNKTSRQHLLFLRFDLHT